MALFDLLNGVEDPPKQQREEYALLLMGVISIRYTQGRYHRTLPEVRLDPSDVAQDVLMFLLRKTQTGRLRIDSEVRVESERPLVLLRLLYTSIYRFTCSAITEARRKHAEVAATDYYHATDSGGLEACSRSGDAAGAVAVIRDLDEAEDFVVGGIVTKTPAETEAVNQLWLCLSESFVTDGVLLSYDELPESIRKEREVSLELHARILARFNKYLTEVTSTQ